MSMKVMGNYTSVDETEKAVSRLFDQGYPSESITFIANDELIQQLEDDHFATDDSDMNEHKGIWQRIKDTVMMHPKDNIDWDQSNLSDYKDAVANGSILVVADESKLPDNLKNATASNSAAAMNSNTESSMDADMPVDVNDTVSDMSSSDMNSDNDMDSSSWNQSSDQNKAEDEDYYVLEELVFVTR